MLLHSDARAKQIPTTETETGSFKGKILSTITQIKLFLVYCALFFISNHINMLSAVAESIYLL